MRGSPTADYSYRALRPPAADDAPILNCFVSFSRYFTLCLSALPRLKSCLLFLLSQVHEEAYWRTVGNLPVLYVTTLLSD